MSVRIITGDCRAILATLPADSVHCCTTSPPYWGLRDYGIPPSVWGGDAACEHAWGEAGRSGQRQRNGADGGIHTGRSTNKLADNVTLHPETGAFCSHCGAWRGAFGLEPTYQLYIEHAVEVFRALRRVLRPDGTLWLNLGDSYAANQGMGHSGRHASGDTWGGNGIDKRSGGLKAKDLCGIPWRVALALQEDGWWLRQDIIWSKPNPMPESVTDRCTKAHEYVFLMSKSARYYFDAEAIKENGQMLPSGNTQHKYVNDDPRNRTKAGFLEMRAKTYPKVNRRSVWEIATSPFPEAHFATFPPALVEPCILAGCPKGGTVLDPFGGAGTTGLVADRLQRYAILIELNPNYAEMAQRRIAGDTPLFSNVEN